MRYALLVALREYAENARTKGFWIGLLLLPVMLYVGIQAPRFLEERAAPTRHYVLVDRSGQYREVVERGLSRYRTRRRLEAFQAYVRRHMREDAPEKERQEAPRIQDLPPELADPAAILERLTDAQPELLDLLATEDGWQAQLAQVEPLLEPDRPPFEEPRLRFREVPLPAEVAGIEDLDELAGALRPWLLGEKKLEVEGEVVELFAAILVPEDADQAIRRSVLDEASDLAARVQGERRGGVQYWSVNLTDTDLREVVEKSINEAIRAKEYVRLGVDAGLVRQVQQTSMPVRSLNPQKEAGEEEVSLADTLRQWAPLGFVYLLWIAIFTVANMLLNNTIEEKSNRIIEVLLSSVTPWELMGGKLLGIAAIGLTMLATWAASLVGILWWQMGPETEWAGQVLDVVLQGGLLPAFGAYFLLGYLFYAGLFLAMGSVCNTLKEAQNLMGPVMLVLFVPLITMVFIAKDPNGTLATILSWIPLYTPFVMMNRAAADPPRFDLIGTVVLMVVSSAAALWMSGKVFRIGILRTGQPPRLLELLRWLRQSD